MPFTVVVTRNAPGRTRGFLASVMLEIAPGVYVSPAMTRGVRERVWDVMLGWASLLPEDGGILMTYPERGAPGGQTILTVGFPKAQLVDETGFWLARRDLPPTGTSDEQATATEPSESKAPSGE
jgi:CRISPR-associated protein Cas2